MGARFWITIFGCIIGFGVAGFLFFLLLNSAWVRWGAIGAMVFSMGLVLGIAWLYDRAATRRREV